MSALRYLLFPFSLLYGLVTAVRNFLYDRGILKSYSFDIPVIGIGNLSTGGTGKTPMAEYVLRLLLDSGCRPALLSRGYGRKTKGYIFADILSDAEKIGDEPYQILRKFPSARVAVCENRVEGIRRLMEDSPEINVIVLDDCFQHRRLKAGMYILLTQYSIPYFKDWLLPAGNLRESRSGRERADMIIMTKCPMLPQEEQKKDLLEKLKLLPGQYAYFTGMRYDEPMPARNALPGINLKECSVLLFTGIASPQPLINYLEQSAFKTKALTFPDHHTFTEQEIIWISLEFEKLEGENKIILTTEKDWRRMEHSVASQKLNTYPVYFLPVGMRWDAMEKRSFDMKILEYVIRENPADGRLHSH